MSFASNPPIGRCPGRAVPERGPPGMMQAAMMQHAITPRSVSESLPDPTEGGAA